MLSDGGCRASGVVPRLLTQQFAAAERENRLLLRFLRGARSRRLCVCPFWPRAGGSAEKLQINHKIGRGVPNIALLPAPARRIASPGQGLFPACLGGLGKEVVPELSPFRRPFALKKSTIAIP